MKDYGKEIQAALRFSLTEKGKSEEYKRFAGKYELPGGVMKRLKLIPTHQNVLIFICSVICFLMIFFSIKYLFT